MYSGSQEVGRQTDEVTRQTKGNNLHCELSISLRGEKEGKEGSGTVGREQWPDNLTHVCQMVKARTIAKAKAQTETETETDTTRQAARADKYPSTF